MRREQGSKLKGRASLLATEVAGIARRSQAPRQQQMTLQIRYMIDSLLTNESARSPAPLPPSPLWEDPAVNSMRLSKPVKPALKADPKPSNTLPNNAQIAKIYSPSGRISPVKTAWKLTSAYSFSPVPSHRVAARSARLGLHTLTPVLKPRREARSPALPSIRMSDCQRY